jgi:hypothetical protein
MLHALSQNPEMVAGGGGLLLVVLVSIGLITRN